MFVQPAMAHLQPVERHGWETTHWGEPWPGPLPVFGRCSLPWISKSGHCLRFGAIVHVLLVMQNASFCHTESKEPLEARWAFVSGKARWDENHEIGSGPFNSRQHESHSHSDITARLLSAELRNLRVGRGLGR